MNLIADLEREIAQLKAEAQRQLDLRMENCDILERETERADQADAALVRARTALSQSETLLGQARRQISELKLVQQQAKGDR